MATCDAPRSSAASAATNRQSHPSSTVAAARKTAGGAVQARPSPLAKTCSEGSPASNAWTARRKPPSRLRSIWRVPPDDGRLATRSTEPDARSTAWTAVL
jgi:hypothetical protein